MKQKTGNSDRADWSRTCEGCEHVVAGPWARGKTGFWCNAPGPNKGYHIGTERFFPYVPAWCPVKLRETEPSALRRSGVLREEAVQK